MKLDIESKITLDSCRLREYQEPIWDAIENEGYRRVLWISPRRSGKDFTSFNLGIRQCLRKPCLILYCLPTYRLARRIIWDGLTIDGRRFLSFIPKQVISNINQTEMKVTFHNGSILQVVGAADFDKSLVGTNPYGVILSEFGIMENGSEIFQFIRPILAANMGWCLLVSTPRGKNHMWHLWKLAQELPDWYVLHQKTSEINHISPEIIAEERAQMSEELYLQEYECSFDRGIEGSIYGKYLDKMRFEGRICHVPWEAGLQVHVAIDIGVKDATSLIFFQVVQGSGAIRIIDCYSNTGVGLDHYARVIFDKPYAYGKFFAPHDIKVREWAGGAMTRYDKAKELGINFTLLDSIGLDDGIENVWTHFSKFWIDEERCKSLINALENYRREWDEKRQIYTKPIHNWASHYADCIRYMCMSLYKTKKGLSSEEFDRIKAEALYGTGRDHLPRFFRNDPRYDRQR